MSTNPERRTVTGLLLLDKPSGISSNAALQRAKRLFGARKAGHTGSLDPLATGLLPVCFGEATKISGFLLDADKRYRVVSRLGVTTTTGDSEGEITGRRSVGHLGIDAVQTALGAFRGNIEQIPPMYSALKHNGERLYRLARQGIQVERKPRSVHVYELKVVDYRDDVLELDVVCSKGTYVRTLVEDIGERLGTGAHVIGLRRTGLGPFTNPIMYTFDMLEALAKRGAGALAATLIPMDEALVQWPAVSLNADMAYYMLRGQAVLVPRLPSDGWVRLYAGRRGFIGMGEVTADGRVAPKRLLSSHAGGGG